MHIKHVKIAMCHAVLVGKLTDVMETDKGTSAEGWFLLNPPLKGVFFLIQGGFSFPAAEDVCYFCYSGHTQRAADCTGRSHAPEPPARETC